MRAAIMQPYFFPYIGYFQLIESVDLFVIYDNIKYTKKGWINRNRMLKNGMDETFSLPLKKGSDFLDVRDRELAESFERVKWLNKIKAAYQTAPYYKDTFPLIERIVMYQENNLFGFIFNSILKICEYLGIETRIQVSSDIEIDCSLRGQDKVLSICEVVGANTYINSIGGVELYSKEAFQLRGIELAFIQSKPFEYEQFNNKFVPWLSIIDVLMFNSIDAVKHSIKSNYQLS